MYRILKRGMREKSSGRKLTVPLKCRVLVAICAGVEHDSGELGGKCERFDTEMLPQRAVNWLR